MVCRELAGQALVGLGGEVNLPQGECRFELAFDGMTVDTGRRFAYTGTWHQDTLPESIRILHYPVLDIANNYPTLGPTGMTTLNVNGLAGSLEMYFGEDILKQADGTLMPVQWRGYDTTLRLYQGELLYKTKLQSEFFKKLDMALADPSLIKKQDWGGMILILDSIRSAFAKNDRHCGKWGVQFSD